MTAQPLVQFGAVTLNPAPDGGVIRLQTTLGEQLFDIAQRERVAQIPAHGAQNQLGLRLPPLEDLRSGCVIYRPCRLPAISTKVATHPVMLPGIQRFSVNCYSSLCPRISQGLTAIRP